MNRFWGRNDDSRFHKFSRDDDLILSLNYENLCDSEYLNRIFIEEIENETETGQNVSEGSIATTSGVNWSLTPDIPEDVTLLQEDKSLGFEFMRKRIISELSCLSKFQDNLSTLIHRQVNVFEYVGAIISEKVCNHRLQDISLSVSEGEDPAKPMDVFLNNCLLNSFISLEKRTRKGCNPSDIEPHLQLLINSFIFPKKKSSTKLKDQSGHHLRAIFCNCLMQFVNFESRNFHSAICTEIIFRCSLTSSYGLLLSGCLTNDSEEVLMSVLQLILMSAQYDEWTAKDVDVITGTNLSELTLPSVGISRKVKIRQKQSDAAANVIVLPTTTPSKTATSKLVLSSQCPEDVGDRDVSDFLNRVPVYSNSKLTTHSWDRKVLSSSQSAKKPGDKDKELKFLVKAPKSIISRTTSNNVSILQDDQVHAKLIASRLSESHPPSVSSDADRKTLVGLAHVEHDATHRPSLMSNLLFVPRGLLFTLYSSLKPQSPSESAGSVSSKSKMNVNENLMSRFPSYVWTCGQNSYGELGHGDINQRRSFSKVSYFDDKFVSSIGAGNEHSAFVTQDGKVIVAGYNDNGQCGLGTTQQVRQLSPISSLDAEEVCSIHIYNGCEHTLAITKEGKLYSFGYNYRGQLGHGSTSSESIPKPVKNLMSKRVIMAACSYHHSLVVCSDHTMYSFGRNDCGQLGHGDTVDKKSPYLIPGAPKDISSVSCGQFHSIIASSSGTAYLCGKNDYGQLGLETSESVKVFLPLRVASGNENVIQVCCGYYHTLVLLHNGSIFGFGRNDYGQLGLGHSQAKVNVPQMIISLNDKCVTSISAGCYHSVATTSNGMLYVFGRNNHGQLGTGDVDERHSPHPVDNFVGKKVLAVSAGFYHTVVLTSDCKREIVKEPCMHSRLSTDDANSFWDFLKSNFEAQHAKDSPSSSREDCSAIEQRIKGHPKKMALTRDLFLHEQDLESRIKHLKFQSSASHRPDHRYSLNIRGDMQLRHFIKAIITHLLSMTEASEACEFSRNASAYCWASKNISAIRTHSSWLIRTIRSLSIVIELIRSIMIPETSLCKSLETIIEPQTCIEFLISTIRIINRIMHCNGDFLVALCENFVHLVQESGPNHDFDFPSRHNSKKNIAELLLELHSDASELFQSPCPDGVFTPKSDLHSIFSSDDRKIVISSLSKLRSEIFDLYINFSCDQNSILFKEFKDFNVDDAIKSLGLCLSTNIEFLFPSVEDQSKVFVVLGSCLTAEYELEGSKSCNPNRRDRCLKLFTRLCLRYREIDSVIKLFHSSKYHSLVLFKQILDAYNKLSMISLGNRVQQSSGLSNSDVFKSVGTLEHCCSNFIKCVIPICFQAGIQSDLGNGENDLADVFDLGISIILELCSFAETVLEYVTQLNILDPVSNVFQYGTIIPSILPTALLYCIHYSKSSILALDVLPGVQSLMKKIYFVVSLTMSSGSSQYSDDSLAAPLGQLSCIRAAPNKRNVDRKYTSSIASGTALTTSDSSGGNVADDQVWRRDMNIVSWWSRLLKICTILCSRLAGALVYDSSSKIKLLNRFKLQYKQTDSFDSLLHHSIWNFIFAPTFAKSPTFNSILSSPSFLELWNRAKPTDQILSEKVGQSYSSMRTHFFTIDASYRVVHSSKQPESAARFQCLESIIVDTVCLFEDFNFDSISKATSSFWESIATFSKTLFRSRSQFECCQAGSASWIEVMDVIIKVSASIRNLLRSCQSRVSSCLPCLSARSLSTNSAKRAFRRVVITIICCNRWKRAVATKLACSGVAIVSFFLDCIRGLTDNFTDGSISGIQNRWEMLQRLLFAECESANRLVQGSLIFSSLLRDSKVPSMKADVLCELCSAWKGRVEAENIFLKGGDYWDLKATIQARQSVSVLLKQVCFINKDFLTNYRSNMASSTSSEIILVAISIKFIHLFISHRPPKFFGSLFQSSFRLWNRTNSKFGWSLWLTELRALYLLLNERQSDISHISAEDKAASLRRAHPRDRSKALRKASSSIVFLIQEISISEVKSRCTYNRAMILYLLRWHCDVLTAAQKAKMISNRNGLDVDSSGSFRYLSGDLSPGNSSVGFLSSTISNGKLSSKESTCKKRCQDLITKPVEFSRSQEGYLIQSDKLLNNYKGTDFTFATWILIKKKNISKSGFIAGRLSHNDAWPLVVIRTDCKIGVYFGHGNEFDSVTSQVIIPLSTWTHISVVVEAKKVKIFVNGNPDSQAITKGNTRAVLYPMIIGCCPQAVRTRIEHVREGFDGLLAQFKYYTRALSPIHVRVIFDQGPPESYDILERRMYQLTASFSILVDHIHKFQQLESDLSDHTIIAETLHLLFATDVSPRQRIASLSLFLQVLKNISLPDLILSAHSGVILPDSHSASIVSPNLSCPVDVKVSSCIFLNGESFMERMAQYFIRLIGICWSPHFLAVPDDLSAEMVDIVSVIQQQSRGSRLSQHYATELESDLNVLRECLDFSPSILGNRITRADQGIVAPTGSGIDTSNSRDDQLNELFHSLKSSVMKLIQAEQWREAFTRAVGHIFSRSVEIVTTGQASDEPTKPSLKSGQLRLFGRSGAWSILSEVDVLGASLLLGDCWSGLLPGSTVSTCCSNSESTILSINKGNNLATLLGWSYDKSRQQIQQVKLGDIAPILNGNTVWLAALGPKLLELIIVLKDHGQVILTDNLSILCPDHSFQRQSLLRVSRPLEVLVLQNLLKYLSNCQEQINIGSFCEMDKLQQFCIDTCIHTLSNSIKLSDLSRLSQLWSRGSKCIAALMGKVMVSEYPPVEAERPLLDFFTKNMNISFLSESIQPSDHHWVKQGQFASLVLQFPSTILNESSESIFYPHDLNGISGNQFEDKNKLTHDQTSLKPSDSRVSSRLPMNDWLSAAAEGHAVNLFGSSVIDSPQELPAVSALEAVYLIRQSIIMDCKQMLLEGLLTAAVFQSLPFKSKVLVWMNLSKDANNRKKLKTVKMMTEDLFNNHRVELTSTLISSLRFCAFSSNHQNISNPNQPHLSNVVNQVYSSTNQWVEFSYGSAFEIDVCISLLKSILPILTYIDSPAAVIELIKICRSSLCRLIYHLKLGASLQAELFDLARSEVFSSLRARSLENLFHTKAPHRQQFDTITQGFIQIASSLEIIQRCIFFGASSLANTTALLPNARTGKLPTSTSAIEGLSAAPPNVIGVKQNSIEIDLTSSRLAASQVLSYFQAIEDIKTNPFSLDDFLSFSDSSTCASELSGEGIIVQVALAVYVEGEDCVYETIFHGSASRFSQYGLSSNCSYRIKCKTSICCHNGCLHFNWSVPISFTTEDGVGFTFDCLKCGSDILLSDDRLTATYTGDDCWSTLLGSKSFTTGVTSWKIKVSQSSTAYIFVGVASGAAELNTFLGGCSNGWGFIGEQALYHNREKVKVYGESFAAGDIIGVVLDLNVGTLSFSKNGKTLGVAFDKIYGELFPAVAFYNVGQELEILSGSFQTNSPQEPFPCSLSRPNTEDLSTLTELTFCFNSRLNLSADILSNIVDHCNQWCRGALIRYRTASGKSLFLSLVRPPAFEFELFLGDRVRSQYGIAEVIGYAFNRVWFHICGGNSIWFFSYNQIRKGQEKGYFIRVSYEQPTIVTLNDENPIDLKQETKAFELEHQGEKLSLQYDVASLSELLEADRWSAEMDFALLDFISRKAADLSVSPLLVPASAVLEDFRSLQQQLSRLVLNSAVLSHRWGIAGPKRKAVIARLGLLRYFNHLVDSYLPALLLDIPTDMHPLGGPEPGDQFSARLVTIFGTGRTVSQHTFLESKPINSTALQLSWTEKRSPLSSSLPQSRTRVFTDLKLVHFWEILFRSAAKTAKTDDDYDYPEDLPLVKINRFKSFRAREASELLGISGEDLLQSSMFCQLWRELRKNNQEKLRICYTHPMDDGQSRAFKIKFDGEGVDDYGGPYREIFQQICDELQRPDPSAASSFQDKQSRILSVDSPPTRCFIPLLLPTANWTSSECTERYKYTFVPGELSKLNADLYRFLGQLVGIALRSKITLDLMLPSFIWKYVVMQPWSELDLESLDITFCQYIKQLSAIQLKLQSETGETLDLIQDEAENYIQDQCWTVKLSDGRVIELIPGGANKNLTLSDISTYLSLSVSARLHESLPALVAFKAGIEDVVPQSAIALLSWVELEHLVCGSAIIDINRLKCNTEYDDDLSQDDLHVLNFWKILEEFSEEEKSLFLRFVWARPTLPPTGVEFPQKFKIQSAVGEDSSLLPDQYLPKAHTCFFSINLPKYSSKKVMAEKLRYAIANCSEMDADFKTTEVEVVGWGLNLAL